jgi:hypothetical protein
MTGACTVWASADMDRLPKASAVARASERSAGRMGDIVGSGKKRVDTLK